MSEASEEQFVKLLQENQNIVHKICRLYTHDQDSHNDLFQEITIQLWKAYPNFRGDSKFTTWAYRVGLNTAITLYRKKKKTINTIEFDNTFHKVKQEDYNFEEEEQIKLLYSAIGELNDIEKALVFLYLEEKDYREISETLGITEVNARVKMNRLKGKLKKILNP
ncbi:sigma-70 family RNA polymerase sigma factor [Flavobacterium sp.]|jgi:RNA polymerase sigma-70 factor (ECF subfamily)|uniref:RNA polymerase sigma factor n=1 Tax=Flavobacterium sp. TaxID=239 RepID=UPI002A81352D|nr:sigma-70 family RNA polymerase sigma factor [Flavobacterium sp.]